MKHIAFRHLALGAFSLLAAGMLGQPFASGAHAQVSVCRTDPIVTLSNGRTFDLGVDISTDASQVRSVEYYLQGPFGASLVSTQQSGAVINKEHFHYQGNNYSGLYTAQIVVRTQSAVPVTAYFYLANSSGTKLSLADVPGRTNDWQQATFTDASNAPVAQSAGKQDLLPYTVPQPTSLSSWLALLTQMFGFV